MLSNLRLLAPGWLVAVSALVTPLGAQCWPEELTATEYLASLIIDTRARHSSCAGRQLLFHQMILTPLRWREDLLASRTGSRVKHGLNMWESDLDVQNCKVLTIKFPTS